MKKNLLVSKAVIYNNKGQTLLRKGDSTSAEELFRKSIAINLQKGNEIGDAQQAVARLVNLFFSQGRLPEADTWLHTLRRSVDSFPDNAAELDWRELRSKYLELTGQPVPALRMLRSYQSYKDSLEKVHSPLNAIDLDKQFVFLSNENQLTLLKKDNELKTAWLIVAILLFLFAAFIAFQVWHNWRKSRTNAAKLKEMNFQIAKQNEILEKSLTSLEQSHQDNSKMLKVVAHDLRNPVGVIMPLTDLLEGSGVISDPGNLELLSLIKKSASHSLHLINELMELSFSSDIRVDKVQLDTVIHYCIEILQPNADKKEQHITASLLPAPILADREKIWRVFSNLLTNAIKFSPRGAGIEVSMELLMDNTVRVAVKDEGMGIPPAIMDKLFSFSQTGKRRGTEGEESFGLGLVICKQILEAHGGKIWIESEEGKGTVFYVELPMI